MQPREDDSTTQFARFAYKTVHSSSRIPDPLSFRPATLVKRDQPDHLPDSQLAQLSKCICCGLEWTSRKTPNQKRMHVDQCARKHALTKDTIRILVGKELATTQSTLSSRADSNETTLMSLVVPPGPVKKLKRQRVLATIKTPPETRNSILNRARDILGPTNGQADPQPTQQFGRSALACRDTQHLVLLDANKSVEELSCTQTFGASPLRVRAVAAERPVDRHEEFSFLQDGTSLFAQDLSCNNHKRPASPLPVNNDSRAVKQRFLQ